MFESITNRSAFTVFQF